MVERARRSRTKAGAGKSGSPAKSTTLDKSAAPAKSATPAKSASPSKDGTAGKNGVPSKNDTPSKNGTPGKNGTPAKNATPNKNGTPEAPAVATGKAAKAKDVSPARKEVVRKPSEKKPSARPESSGHVELGFLAGYVGFHLRLAQDASYRAFARHRDKDLIKPGRFPALAIIHLNPGISQSALGRAIARDKSTVSPLIKDLQKNGFISRKPSPSDRRSVTLALTKKGERTLDRLQVRAQDHETEIDRLIGTSKARLLTLLDKITGGLTE